MVISLAKVRVHDLRLVLFQRSKSSLNMSRKRTVLGVGKAGLDRVPAKSFVSQNGSFGGSSVAELYIHIGIEGTLRSYARSLEKSSLDSFITVSCLMMLMQAVLAASDFLSHDVLSFCHACLATKIVFSPKTSCAS